MYTDNQEIIVEDLNNEHRLIKGNRNLYKISYLEMAVLFDRREVVTHLLGKSCDKVDDGSGRWRESNATSARGSKAKRKTGMQRREQMHPPARA